MRLKKSIRLFRAAVAILREIDPGLTLYVASDTLCLIRGESHDNKGRPRQSAVIDASSDLRISGGDW